MSSLNAEAKLPIDPNVTVPPVLAKQIADVNALHERHYPKAAAQVTPPTDPNAPMPSAVGEPPAPVVTAAVTSPAAPAVPAAPDLTPSTPEQRAGVDPASDAGKFYAMEGRYRQSQATVGQLQQQMSELGDELMRCQQTIAALRNGTAPPPQQQQRGQPPQRPNGQRLITPDDEKTYGPELIDVVTRIARDAITPDLQAVQQQTRQTSQRVMQGAQAQLYLDLDRDVPTWRTVNTDPRFKMWCRSPDVYSGVVRGQLLRDAFQAADAPRVVSFFKGFLAEEVATGQVPAPGAQPQVVPPAPRIAAVPLENLTVPGRAKPAGGDTPANAADKPIITRAQVAAFYANVRAGRYAGLEAEKAADEKIIFTAQAEGRIR